MHKICKYFIILILLGITCLWSCKKWDDHIAVNQKSLNKNLLEEIAEHPELSSFTKYLRLTGLDKVVGSSVNHTVWAPDNKAFQNIPDSIVNDTAKLKALLLNHISGQLYFTRMAGDSVRVPVLNGKYIFFSDHSFDEASIEQADIHVRNGVLHIIDKYIAPLPSVWEYLLKTKDKYKQSQYVTALNYRAQDPSQAVLDSINPLTGQPVYVPGTGIVNINTYLTKVYDISEEDSLYTYVILVNNAFNTYREREKPFFKSSDAVITDSNACWNVTKDLAFKGLYLPDDLPDTLVSKFNVHVPINKSAILEVHKASNGIIYVMNEADCALNEKIPVCIVQGEYPVGFSSVSESFMERVFYRSRMNEETGKLFNDIYLFLGSSGANDYVDFATNGLYTTKYKVYWVALNDFTVSGQNDDPYGTDSALHQILEIGDYIDTAFNPVFTVDTTVSPYYYKEVYLGEFTNDEYDWLLSFPLSTPDGRVYTYTPATQRLRLQSPAKVPSGVPHNLTVDYIKLVPDL